MPNKKYLFIVIFILAILAVLFFLINVISNNEKYKPDNNKFLEFNKCLSENGIVIYGSSWCPACRQVVDTLGGYESIKSIYVDCDNEQQRCANEKKTDYVPEIQINSKIYSGSRTLKGFSESTGCPFPK